MSFDKIVVPTAGEKVTVRQGKLHVPDHPILAFIEGDGIGPDIMTASRRIWDAAVQAAYGGQRQIAWMEIYAGEKAAGCTAATTCPRRPSTRCASSSWPSKARSPRRSAAASAA